MLPTDEQLQISTEEQPSANGLDIPDSGRGKQIIASLIVSSSCLLSGMALGWGSPVALLLNTTASPVGMMTKPEIANLLTMPIYASIPLPFLVVTLKERLGTINTLLISTASYFVAFAIFTATNSLWMLYVGKLISLIGSTALMVIPSYVIECVHHSRRGFLLAMVYVQLQVGMLVAYVLGKFLDYQWFNAATMIVAEVVGFLITVFLPESPYFLVSKGKLDEAERSLLWLRGGNHHIAQLELDSIKSQLAQPGDSKLLTQKRGALRSFLEHCKNRGTRRALLIVLALICLLSFSGIHEVLQYTGLIFKEANGIFGPEDSSIIIAALGFTSSICSMFIGDKIGRKPFLFVSCITGVVTLSVLSCFLYLQKAGFYVNSFRWVPIISLGIFVFSHGTGLGTVTTILINELLHAEIRVTVYSVLVVLGPILTSVVLLAFPYIDQYFGLYAVFILPACFNGLGALFTWAFVPETRGKSLQLIAEELNR